MCSIKENSSLIREFKAFCGGTDMMCMDIAPSSIAACVPPSKDKYYFFRVPFCHLPKGHAGPHVCGEFRWENTDHTDEIRSTEQIE